MARWNRPAMGDIVDARWARLRRIKWDPDVAEQVGYWICRAFMLPPVRLTVTRRRLKSKTADYFNGEIRFFRRPSLAALVHELAHHYTLFRYRCLGHRDRFKRAERAILNLLFPDSACSRAARCGY